MITSYSEQSRAKVKQIKNQLSHLILNNLESKKTNKESMITSYSEQFRVKVKQIKNQ